MRSPLPTLAVWIGDALSGPALQIYWRAIQWRKARLASDWAWHWAIIELAAIALFFLLLAGRAV